MAMTKAMQDDLGLETLCEFAFSAVRKATRASERVCGEGIAPESADTRHAF